MNSFASSVTARNTVVVHRRLAEGHDVELVETNRRGHATRFAHDAARRGIDVVVGYGGDGTLNEVATGIAGTDTALGQQREPGAEQCSPWIGVAAARYWTRNASP